MTRITIRNVDDELKERLKARASEHGRSMEAEAREILREVLERAKAGTTIVPGNMGDAIRAIVEPVGGLELDIPPRSRVRTRKLPSFR